MARIAIFDSGVGGLSIYKAAKQVLADNQFIFVSDNQCYPYGNKSESFLIDRVTSLGRQIADQCSPDVVVVACNTASTIVLPSLRHELNIPIVGVVPAIKPAAQLSITKHIGVLATPGTIARPYTKDLISEFAPDCTVIKIGSSKLVDLAEQKLHGKEVNLDSLGRELEPFLKDKKLDLIVLACTHFPLLNNEISVIFKENNHKVMLVDSADGIANRLKNVCSELAIKNRFARDELELSSAYFTKEIKVDSYFARQLETMGLKYEGLL